LFSTVVISGWARILPLPERRDRGDGGGQVPIALLRRERVDSERVGNPSAGR